MSLTSLMPQKPINTLKARNHDFLRSSYYGSIGRPDRSVKRRSAVELLQESKAFYVKSESVLDGRQELKNADHLHVRSPTRIEVVSTLPRRGGHHNHCLPLSCYSICPTCYPHATATNKDHLHLDHFQLQTLQQHYLLHYERLQRESRDALKAGSAGFQSSKSDRKLRRSSVPSTFTVHSLEMERTSRAFDHSTTSPFATVERLPPWTEAGGSLDFNLGSNQPSSPKFNHGNVSGNVIRAQSPPPLPPKSPRAMTKPIRPHDFPQRLKGQGEASPEFMLIQPPSPPVRRNSDHHVSDVHAKLRRLIRDRPSLKCGNDKPHQTSASTSHQPIQTSAVPVTLPSPILPIAPLPTDVIMESPMSDSGPIISPPPAFSTPVTPMIDRQNSSASEKSHHHNNSTVIGSTTAILAQSKLPPLFSSSGTAMSVISASSGRSRKSAVGIIGGGESGNASISDISMRHSTSDSTSSPMSRSPAEGTTTTNGGTTEEDSTRNNCSRRSAGFTTSRRNSTIPKSVTENALSRVASFDSGMREHWGEKLPGTMVEMRSQQARHHSISSQTEGTPMGVVASSPIRRPILRSKSDLSHRYKKSGSTAHLLRGSGFTLVPVDFGSTTFCTPFVPEGKYGTTGSIMETRRQQDSRRASRTSADLERFFDKMGLENTDDSQLQPPLPPIPIKFGPSITTSDHQSNSGSSPIFFSSMSSIDSIGRRDGSIESGDSPGHREQQRYVGTRTCGGYAGYVGGAGPLPPPPLLEPPNSASTANLLVQHGEPSIVERNARVIKWLFNCRKAVENTRSMRR